MKIFLFYFEMAIKITGSAQNYRVGRVSGNTPIFFSLKLKYYFFINGHFFARLIYAFRQFIFFSFWFRV